jgi:hypothetical protein
LAQLFQRRLKCEKVNGQTSSGGNTSHAWRVSLIIFKNLQLECIFHYLSLWPWPKQLLLKHQISHLIQIQNVQRIMI